MALKIVSKNANSESIPRKNNIKKKRTDQSQGRDDEGKLLRASGYAMKARPWPPLAELEQIIWIIQYTNCWDWIALFVIGIWSICDFRKFGGGSYSIFRIWYSNSWEQIVQFGTRHSWNFQKTNNLVFSIGSNSVLWQHVRLRHRVDEKDDQVRRKQQHSRWWRRRNRWLRWMLHHSESYCWIWKEVFCCWQSYRHDLNIKHLGKP